MKNLVSLAALAVATFSIPSVAKAQDTALTATCPPKRTVRSEVSSMGSPGATNQKRSASAQTVAASGDFPEHGGTGFAGPLVLSPFEGVTRL